MAWLCFLGVLIAGFLPCVFVEGASPVQLNVYYESKCPDSRQFFSEQLTPTYAKIPSYVNLDLIPYGNARYEVHEGVYTFKCQHGPDECYGNLVQSCFVEIVNNTKSSLKFIDCAFNGQSQKKIIDECIESKDTQALIRKCVKGPMGNSLQYQMAKKTDSLYPQQTFIPWVTVNGKGGRDLNDKAMDDLLSVICNELTDEKPSVCNQSKRAARPYRYRGYYQ